MQLFDITSLTEFEKSLLARDLLESAVAREDHSPLPDDQLAELRRRAAALDAGEASLIPWEMALADILSRRGA